MKKKKSKKAARPRAAAPTINVKVNVDSSHANADGPHGMENGADKSLRDLRRIGTRGY